MVDNSTEWTREFARTSVRDALAQVIDDATPGLIERLATDSSAYGELLTATHLVAAESEELLRETITSARNAGLNWEQIGLAIGISRQAAQQRFGSGKEIERELEPENAGLPPVGTRVTISHDFTGTEEIKMLNRAGLYGWHAVSFTTGTWTFEFDIRQWQHEITTGKIPPGPGWDRLGRWTFWVFWARPTNLPRLPGNPEPDAFKSDKKLRKALGK